MHNDERETKKGEREIDGPQPTATPPPSAGDGGLLPPSNASFSTTSGWTTLTSQSPFTVGGRLGIIHIDTNEGRVPTMPFVGHLKPLENDVDAMNMVKCIRCYNEVEVYVMFLDDYENAIGNKGDGGGGDNEVGNFDVGDKVDGAVSEEDNAHRVHFGCSENKQEKRYDRVKLKERRKGKAGASGVSPSRVGGSGVDPSGVSPSEAGASGVGLIGIDARGVGSTWLMQVGLILVQERKRFS
ncbi:hypothetical protein CFP56_020984 [Quercus suber]|uniref:Uncharacterized protein n=1 Tax=Quercus suber TaxID=58331 RepID=A0AAW0M2H8_QUESU